MTGSTDAENSTESFNSGLVSWKEIFASLLTAWLDTANGALISLSAVAIPELSSLSPDSDKISMNDEQISWFASIYLAGAIPCSMLGGIIAHKLGRMRLMRLITPLLCISGIFIAISNSVLTLMAARLLAGCAGGLLAAASAVYISEVSSPGRRTMLVATIDLFSMTGSIFTFALGAFVHWRTLALITSFLPVPSLLAFLVMLPESPMWSVHKGRMEEAHRSLQWFFSSSSAAAVEMERLRESHSSETKSTSTKSWSNLCSDLSRSDVYKPIFLVSTLFVCQQFSGRAAILFYAIPIFVEAAPAINENLASILFGLTSITGQLFGLWLLLKWPRRPLLGLSAILTTLGTAILALTANMQVQGKMIDFLPALGIVIIGFGFQLGLGSIPWALSSEVFPTDVRSHLNGSMQALGLVSMFTVVKTYPNLKNLLSVSGAFWLYASFGFLALIHAIFLLPETKDLRLEDITENFKRDEIELDTKT